MLSSTIHIQCPKCKQSVGNIVSTMEIDSSCLTADSYDCFEVKQLKVEIAAEDLNKTLSILPKLIPLVTKVFEGSELADIHWDNGECDVEFRFKYAEYYLSIKKAVASIEAAAQRFTPFLSENRLKKLEIKVTVFNKFGGDGSVV